MKVGLILVLIYSMLFVGGTAASDAQLQDGQLVSTNQCWRYDTDTVMAAAPAFDKDNLYLAERGGRITAISIKTGSRIWSTELGGEVRSNLAVLGSNVYVAVAPVTDNRKMGVATIHALSALTGLPTFEITVTDSSDVRLLAAANELVVLTSDGRVSAYGIDSQIAVWQRTFSAPPAQAIVWYDKVVVANVDLKIRVISLATGSDLAVVPTESPVSALSVIENDLLWGNDRGEIVRYDLARNSVYWRIKNGARISGLVTTNEGVVAASLDNFTYLISPYYGRVRWKKRLPARIESLVRYGKDLIALHAVGESSVTLLNLETGKAAAQISVGDAVFIGPPVAVDARLVFLTNKLVTALSAGPCTLK